MKGNITVNVNLFFMAMDSSTMAVNSDVFQDL